MCSVAAAGHVNPGVPIARELVARGHEVRWYAGRQFRDTVEATGARFEPMQAAHDPAEQTLDERFPERVGLEGLAGFKFDMKYAFLDDVPGQVDDVQRILRDFPADVVLVDTGFIGAGMLHELGGPPWATYGITALTLMSRDTAPFGSGLPPGRSWATRLRNRLMTLAFQHVVFRDVEKHHDRVRAGLGLPSTRSSVLGSTLSPYLYLQGATEAFEYPRRDLPPQLHFIGPLLPDPPEGFEPPAWWPELERDRPVVLVNQGTVATDLGDLVAPALQALADEPVTVVATTAGIPVDDLPFAVPDNTHPTPFVPFGALLPHVDVMITNGGFGGVQVALANGVPLIVAGTTEEKPEVAARVEWAGAGLDLRTKSPSVDQIRTAVHTVLGDPRFRAEAERIAADYARHDAASEAADLLEELATTRRPRQRDGSARPQRRSAVPT
jgi:UDP:flavonoid glycosyltransferase YjiC (YdhE family)